MPLGGSLIFSSLRAVFMNKYDLLEKKLEAGAQVNRYMTSYGARANDAAAFSACTRPSHYLLMVG